MSGSPQAAEIASDSLANAARKPSPWKGGEDAAGDTSEFVQFPIILCDGWILAYLHWVIKARQL